MSTESSEKTLKAERGPKKRFLCATDHFDAHFLATDPKYRARRQEVESFARLARTAPSTRTGQANIPVVVHVVYNTPEQRISKAQIDAQIKVLNADYNAQNTDISDLPAPFKELIGNPNIRFFLATRDPSGRSTNGVVETNTSVKGFDRWKNQLDERMKFAPTGSNGWDSDRYLNIWVCYMTDKDPQDDEDDPPIGFATFPGVGPASEDGVVIDYRYFGVGGTATPPYHLGRTTTHEVGHWFNLRHIWGDDQFEPTVNLRCSRGDEVEDTPNAEGPNFGKKTFPHISCNNGPYGDLFYNYMDYSNDAVTIMFTKGQVARMNATLAGPRASILGSDFTNIRARTSTGLAPTKDSTMHFLIHDLDQAGNKDLIAINKTDLRLHLMSAASKYQSDVFKKSIGFKATAEASGAELTFAFGKWTGDAKPDLCVMQSSPTATHLSILSADSSYQKSVLDAKIKLRFPGPVYSFAIARWDKGEKPDLVILQKPSIRFDTYSVLITVLSGDSNFSTITRTYTTLALDNTSGSLDLQLADWNGDGSLDLVAIKKSNTSKKPTQVTVLSGFSGFKDVIFKTSTLLNGTERNFTFLCGDWNGDGRVDLIGIKKWDTASGKVEVHVLAG